MFTNKPVLLSILIAGVVMAGCAGSEQEEPRTVTGEGNHLPNDGAAAGMQIVGGQLIGNWALVSLNNHSLLEGSGITADFDGEQITGSACNHYFGDYTVEAGSISFSNIGSTDMYCEYTMEQEQTYLEALAGVNAWSVEGSTLTLSGETANLLFERVVPPSDVSLEGTIWMLESFVTGGDAVSSLIGDTTVTATIADGQIAGNATCNSYSGAVSIDGAAITVGEIVATKMACEIGMEQEDRYLATLAEVSTWQIEGTMLTLSADNGNGLVFRAQ
ncbi:MAG: META domain-containing protein [Anaerolineae bacterium]|nr:META domain-containing protein [Anaerolineae bacterium]